MTVELVAHRRADCSRASTVDDADLREPGERRVVDERPDRLARLLRAPAPDVELVRHVAARPRPHPNRRRTLLVGILRVCGRPYPCERDAKALAAGADDFRLVSVYR